MKSKLALILGLLLLAPSAFAQTWSCDLEGEVSGVGIGLGIGAQAIDGYGDISCFNKNTGRSLRLPVKITFASVGWSLFDLSYIRSMRLMAAHVGCADPRDMLGRFSVGATAGANIVNVGADIDAAIKVTRGSTLAFEIGLGNKEVYGAGVRILHGMLLIIEPEYR